MKTTRASIYPETVLEIPDIKDLSEDNRTSLDDTLQMKSADHIDDVITFPK